MEAAAAAGRSSNCVTDEDNKGNRDVDANIRFKSEEMKSKEDLIESTKAELGEVRQENQRLRMHIEKITKDYQILYTRFQNIVDQQETTMKADTIVTPPAIASSSLVSQEYAEEHDISLSLGRTSSASKFKREVIVMNKREDNDGKGSALGLDNNSGKQHEGSKTDHVSSTEPLTNNTSTDNSLVNEEEIMGETWPPPKMLKRDVEEETDSHHSNGKRARVCVRARCDTPTMNDGCQWRKYGQKTAKGNPCPRAYYRCTVAPSCPVRKQVQRCAEDISILITTYEGTHNHPLPAAATAMASTTTAAASMLLSGSSESSRPMGLSQPTSSSTTTSAGLHGLTYNLANGVTSPHLSRAPQQFYIHNNPHISPSPNTHPTITLDLTTSDPFASPFANPHFNRFASSTSYDPSQLFSSKSTSLNFASIDSTNPQAASLSWATTNNHNNALSYRNMYPLSNNRNNHNLGSLTLSSSRHPQESTYQSFMQKPNSTLHINHQLQQQQQPPVLPDHIAAATKAITADPSFQTALAAALTSIIGGAYGGGASMSDNEKVQVTDVSIMDNLGQKMKWVDQRGPNNGCGSNNYLSSTSSSSNAQSTGIIFLQTSSAFSKSKSTSPSENQQEHNAS